MPKGNSSKRGGSISLLQRLTLILSVAPAASTFDFPTDLDDIRAFVLQPGETIVLNRGTWHWGPFPIGGATAVRLLNVQGRRYADDNASVDLTTRTGYVVEVVTP